MLAFLDFLHLGQNGLIASLILGLIIGAIAKLLMPGKDPGGCIVTSLIGIAGAGIGSLIGRAVFSSNQAWGGIILGIIGAMILLFLYRILFKPKV
jgi:uncharacterized membrane protein YeaQ/YmgE (transglycosylase-associated protein family)